MASPSTLVEGSRGPAGRPGAPAPPPGYRLLVMGPAVFATFALPARGQVTIGRGGGADVPVDDPRASRRHARLRIDGDDIAVEDLGSANGTRVRDRALAPRVPAAVLPGEAIGIGALVLMVQPSRPPSAPRALLAHGELAGRVDWECARADATAGVFSVARVRAPAARRPVAGGSPGSVDAAGVADAAAAEARATVLRPLDVLGCWGRGEYEILLPGLGHEAAEGLVRAFAQRLAAAATGGNGSSAPWGLATYPRDGRHAGALLACAGARARGDVERDGGGDRDDGAAPQPVRSLDEAMRRMLELAERAAAGAINVLILGETGAGKEVLARTIHAGSRRAAHPLAIVNCAALSEALLESELFGHERGAFTGAAQAKPGLLETAPGGTVFLDEIGELPLALQAKLLRVIEAREIVRVGGTRPRRIDVRFIAATNRDIEAEVARGAFRRDLYFRLNGMTLTIPPLRERPRDLPVLARAILAALARDLVPGRARDRARGEDRSAPAEISEAAMVRLAAHSWPGNVRELRNVLERALLLSDGPTILPDHLPPEFAPAPAPVPGPDPVPGPSSSPTPTPTPASERARVLDALAACGGNQSRAARQLGVSRKVLIARLDAYGVARPRKPARR